MKKELKYTFVSLIIIAAVGLLGYRIQAVLAKQKDLPQSTPVQTVQVKNVGNVKMENSLELYGSIEAINKVSVSSKLTGRVSKVTVENGQWVNAGDTLVALEDQDYQALLTTNLDNLHKAQLRLNDVQADYEQYQKLLAGGAMAAHDVDKAKLALDVAHTDLNSAQVAVDNAQLSLKETVVTAPLAGVVAYRSVNLGQMVSPGVPLLTLEDVSSVYATVNVKQVDLPQVKEGMVVQIMPSDDDKKILSGEVSLISPVANQAARVFEARVKVENNSNILKPGMFVKTRITLGNPVDVLAIPIYALSGKENAYYVYVAEENQAKKRQVETGATIGDQIEIKSGLKPGDKVIVTNMNKLKDQDKIALVAQ
ncbi:efflux RND transporter periplasmic adaptor subunit [Desulfosporosinus sp. Sb-LF]|uniref:efflux RND transporter periplasmic adaptor subunit n=1 Tax=Desulfosporosinus sp. Sb-LF TaxID=2560027 RepID=UPI00107F38D1|nr:efflux RND transporter periplasmic adaptor subunit [Desulfosporosinus sp. Sb-LF]TGE32974.1 efflux RND transporter periplasmic adaptor subunit [Desulfosporosinus sp. Sb-LF]